MVGIGADLGRAQESRLWHGALPHTGLADMRSWPPVWLARGVILLPVVGPELQTGRKIRATLT